MRIELDIKEFETMLEEEKKAWWDKLKDEEKEKHTKQYRDKLKGLGIFEGAPIPLSTSVAVTKAIKDEATRFTTPKRIQSSEFVDLRWKAILANITIVDSEFDADSSQLITAPLIVSDQRELRIQRHEQRLTVQDLSLIHI